MGEYRIKHDLLDNLDPNTRKGRALQLVKNAISSTEEIRSISEDKRYIIDTTGFNYFECKFMVLLNLPSVL